MLNKNRFILYLIRHGESEVNVQPDLLGQDPETALTARGEEQARLLGIRFAKDNLYFDEVFTSDYKRAFDTAHIACQDFAFDGPVVYSELREYDAGDWKHASRKEIMTLETQLKMGYLNSNFLPPHGESLTQVERRASKWLEETILYNENVIAQSNKPHVPTYAAFSHGMTIKCLLHYVMGFDKSFTWKIDIDNTSITKLSFNLTSEVGWKLHGINDTSHLK